LRIVFMGTPSFAVPVLSALSDAGHEIVGIYTQPDRPAGRGRRTTPTGVKVAALERGLQVYQPASLRKDETARSEIAALEPDVIAVAAYGLYIPAETLVGPPLGCLNVHPSLLPRYRGSSPVATAILDGESVTGVTVMCVTEEMDAGPIVAQQDTAIGPEETTPDLTARLFEVGAELLVEILPSWRRGDIEAREQDESLATATRRLSREDGRVDWSRSAMETARRVRALHPWPGSFTQWRGRLLKIIEAFVYDGTAPGVIPEGEVVAVPDGIGVSTGSGVLALKTIQIEGRRPTGAREFVEGHKDFVGSVLGQ
jgi:methionyl-tRNA formyltransferase